MAKATVTHISGPISAHVYDVPFGRSPPHRVYLFGDAHYSVRNQCSPCDRTRGCAHVTEFIRELVESARPPGVDVYLELPHVPRTDNRSAVRSIRRRFFSQPRPKGLLHRLVQGSEEQKAQYVGVLGDMFARFGRRVYDHNGQQADVSRFHYADIRTEANVRTCFPPRKPHTWLMQHVSTCDGVAKLMGAFLFGTDFVSDVRLACSGDGRTLVTLGPLSRLSPSSPLIHKIAKQFHKLPAVLKERARAFLQPRIDELVNVLRDIGYDAVAPKHNIDSWLQQLSQAHMTFVTQAVGLVVRFGFRVLLMDAYLLCRLLRYMAAGGTSVIYVGDAHAEVYSRFLMEHMSARLVRSRPAALAAVSNKRCLAVRTL
jgi:hypothetical protein